MSYNLFLDDMRNPKDCREYAGDESPYDMEEWVIVRTVSEFKKAILENFSTMYTTICDLVANITGSNPEIRLVIKEIDFVVIDEVDQRFFPTILSMEFYGNQLENILRSRMQNRLPTIMCSNSPDISQIFGGEFKKSFESLGSQFIRILPAVGKDVRLGKEKL